MLAHFTARLLLQAVFYYNNYVLCGLSVSFHTKSLSTDVEVQFYSQNGKLTF